MLKFSNPQAQTYVTFQKGKLILISILSLVKNKSRIWTSKISLNVTNVLCKIALKSIKGVASMKHPFRKCIKPVSSVQQPG